MNEIEQGNSEVTQATDRQDSVSLTPPVEPRSVEPFPVKLEKGIALCLSGGGYRAMLFHLGTLWRLNELGYLQNLDRISSVSGGSITSGLLGLNWSQLTFNNGVASNFEGLIAEPLRDFASITIDRRAVLRGLFSMKPSRAYRELFRNSTLQDLPDRPRFVINATNVQSGVLWRFTKPYMRDYRVGEVKNPRIELAVAVAASAAFPPVLSPMKMKLKESDFTQNSGVDLQFSPYTTRVVLTDGGVYDNLGVETVWKRYETILVSDAGRNLNPEGKPKRDWFRYLIRNLFIIDNQVRSLRKRNLIDAFKGGRPGAYWGIRTNIEDFQLADALDCPFDKTIALANLSTRLKALESGTQERLINWGYAVCDAAMRKHVSERLPAPTAFPFPNVGVS